MHRKAGALNASDTRSSVPSLFCTLVVLRKERVKTSPRADAGIH